MSIHRRVRDEIREWMKSFITEHAFVEGICQLHSGNVEALIGALKKALRFVFTFDSVRGYRV